MKFISPDIIHRYIKMLSKQGLNIQFETNIEKIKSSHLPLIIWNPYGYLGHNKKSYHNKWKLYQWYLKNKLPVYIVERGAFPNCIFIDKTGFNVESKMMEKKYWDKELSPKQQKEIENYLQSFKNDISTLEKQNNTNIEILKTKIAQYEKVIFVPLQVENDTVIIKWSGEIKSVKNFYKFIQQLANQFPKYLFLLKNHPCNKKLYTGNEKNLHIVDNYHYKRLIEISDYIITINSGIGIQATAWNKNIITLGQTFYNTLIQSYNLEDVSFFIQNNISTKPTQNDVKKFLYYLLFEYYTICEMENIKKNISRPTTFHIIRYKDLSNNSIIIDKSKPIQKKNIDNLKIIYLYNEYGWAFHFEALNYQKYSKLNVIPMYYSPFNYEMHQHDALKIMNENPDIIMIPSALHYNKIKNSYINYLKRNGIKIAVQINSHYETKYFCKEADIIICSSKKLYNEIKKYYNYNNIIMQHHFVDTKLFYPRQISPMILGWAGRFDNPIKRTNILLKLGYPILIKGNYHGFLTLNKKHKEMVDFYNKIQILLITSKHEGTPYPVLEAMASGKVVLATDVGICSEILDNECIIYGETEEEIIFNFKRKIKELLNNQEKYLVIANKNLKYIENNLAWSKQYYILDNIYKNLMFTKSHINTMYPLSNNNNLFFNILIHLNNLEINYWLVNLSCLDTIRAKKLILEPHTLEIATTESDKVHNILIQNGWTLEPNYYIKKNKKIKVFIEPPRKIKIMQLFGLDVFVPYPVIKYLKTKYGLEWRKLRR